MFQYVQDRSPIIAGRVFQRLPEIADIEKAPTYSCGHAIVTGWKAPI